MTTSGSAHVPGANWPYDGDAAWITTEETAALDPWCDNLKSPGTSRSSSSSSSSSGPEREREREPEPEPEPEPDREAEQTTIPTRDGLSAAPWTTPEEAAVLDPWGDRPGGAVA
ncbi:hypothetical protein [Kribbella ginsengisoli]|uniref:hypothetical protein n=1 Tax=Kribbella ginsengisoli TaxID=363865 RepID=UPI0031CDEF77